jgi:ribosomal protein S27E
MKRWIIYSNRRCGMALGPHGHEKTGIEVLRVMCPKCGERVSLEPGEDEAKCPKCGTVVKRPAGGKPKED